MTAASRLFNEHGLTASGVDTIIERSGVAKMTFYKVYRGKEALIADYLKTQDEAWFVLLRQHTGKPGLSPERRLMAVFDAFEVWFKNPEFLGCPFINGFAETKSAPRSRSHKNVIRHFAETKEFIFEIARQISSRKAARIAESMMLLMSGAIVSYEIMPGPGVLANARQMLAQLIGASKRG
ncbi:MAG: TetR/AcrR family transcriptional regulator [Leptospirales bacterium]|nr:TetR/AcrR family transcriptional regulator [Leptospirales bacterium]